MEYESGWMRNTLTGMYDYALVGKVMYDVAEVKALVWALCLVGKPFIFGEPETVTVTYTKSHYEELRDELDRKRTVLSPIGLRTLRALESAEVKT